MSEKKIILTSVFGIILLSTVLMYLMLDKDLQKQNKVIVKENRNPQIITAPKIEIETSK